MTTTPGQHLTDLVLRIAISEHRSGRARTVVLPHVRRDAHVLVASLHEERGRSSVFEHYVIDHIEEVVHLRRAEV